MQAGGLVMDCTVGRGGHALEIVKRLAPGGKLVAMDVDPVNLKYAKGRLSAAVEERRKFARRCELWEAVDVLEALGIERVDGLLADFGVSTNQLLAASHGLSFNEESALDMRLDPRIEKKASDLLKEWDDRRIAEVLQDYAQERFARRIAAENCSDAMRRPIATTGQLARLVRSVVPHGGRSGEGSIDPATRTFQALRMAVNEELDHLTGLLENAPAMMNAGGRAVFLSFHSGEDRLVKQAIRGWEETGVAEAVTKKPVEAERGREMATEPAVCGVRRCERCGLTGKWWLRRTRDGHEEHERHEKIWAVGNGL